ncbi:MAG: hypothetical protein KDB07_07160, partial [Planctomycetes bacterium]|nr:hypothetical protein [Planctomycetota bacterium]
PNFPSMAAFTPLGGGTYQLVTPLLNAATLIEGAILVTATASDGINQAMASTQVGLDVATPQATLSLSQPAMLLQRNSNLMITVTVNEALDARPEISITGLTGATAILGQAMLGPLPSQVFTYSFAIGPNVSGTGTITVSNIVDCAGNQAANLTRAIAVPDAVAGLVANAGEDLVLQSPQRITLDGSGSQGATTFAWSQISGPANLALLLNGAKVSASPILPGVYAFELQVSNGSAIATDVVTVTLQNSLPLVFAGERLTLAYNDLRTQAMTGFSITPVGVRGVAFDINGEALTYRWDMISRPVGGNLTLATPTALQSALVVSGSEIVAGVYRARLTVRDASGGEASDEVVILVSSPSVVAPSADAGLDQVLPIGVRVDLTANESSDPNAANPMNPLFLYNWSMVLRPENSLAVLNNPDSKTPNFMPDQVGVYRLRLTVTDVENLESASDDVFIIINDETPQGNRTPRALAELSFVDSNENGAINLGEAVTLDASLSSDGDRDPLTFLWEQTAGPVTVMLDSPMAAMQKLEGLVIGHYAFKLKVHDGKAYGLEDSVSFNVAPTGTNGVRARAAIQPIDDLDGNGEVVFVPNLGVDGDANNPWIELSAAESFSSAGISLYSWKQVSGPTVPIYGADSALLRFAPTLSRVYGFEVTVIDANGLRDSARVNVAVTTFHPLLNPNGNSVPTSRAGNAVGDDEVRTATGRAITLGGSGSDDNDPAENLIFI